MYRFKLNISSLFKSVFFLVVFFTIHSCTTPIDQGNKVDEIIDIYNSALRQSSYSHDSALYLIDEGIAKAERAKHDSLIVLGYIHEASLRSTKGEVDYTDSLYNLIIYGNKYNVDSTLITKAKVIFTGSLIDRGYYDKALKLCQESIRYYDKINYDRGTIVGYLYISKVYVQLHEHAKAMSALTKALDLAEEINVLAFIPMLQNSLGAICFDQGDYDKSIDFFSLALEKYELLGDLQNVAVCYQRIGAAFIEKEEYKTAEEYLLRAYEMVEEIGMDQQCLDVLNSLGVIYQNKALYDEALKCYTEVLELNKKISSYEVECDALNNIGSLFYNQGDYVKAEFYYNKSYNTQKKLGNTDYTDFYTCMMDLNVGKQNWKSAYLWANKLHVHSDSLFTVEKFEASEALHTKYETKKKDLQLKNLKNEKEKDRISILINRIIIIAISFVLLLVFIFSYLYRKQYRLRLDSYKELIKKGHQITAINQTRRNQAFSSNDHAAITLRSRGDDSQKSTIPIDVAKRIEQRLPELIAAKFYTKVGVSLSDTAKMLDTNTKYLSLFINDRFDCNFTSFLNELRIEEAQGFLRNTDYDYLTIEVISQKSGFNSKGAFNAAFKKETGMTPSLYKKAR